MAYVTNRGKSDDSTSVKSVYKSIWRKCTVPHSEKWTIMIGTKLGNRNNLDLGKGVMIQLGYILYVST
jgi:hypothetical protein